MAPVQSELALENELFTQVSLLCFRGAYVFLTRTSFIIHRRSKGDFNAPQLDFCRPGHRANGVAAVLFSDMGSAAA